jgi:hypothetical protein
MAPLPAIEKQMQKYEILIFRAFCLYHALESPWVDWPADRTISLPLVRTTLPLKVQCH